MNNSKFLLSEEIENACNKLIEIISKIPCNLRTDKTIDGTGGKVSVADIIAYQIGWGKLLIGWYEAGIKGELPQMPGEGFSTWDYEGLAKHFYKKYQYDSYNQQLKEFNKVVKQILEIVEKEYQAGNLDKIGLWPWCKLKSGKEWPLSKWIKVNTLAPYKRVIMLIKQSLKNNL